MHTAVRETIDTSGILMARRGTSAVDLQAEVQVYLTLNTMLSWPIRSIQRIFTWEPTLAFGTLRIKAQIGPRCPMVSRRRQCLTCRSIRLNACCVPLLTAVGCTKCLYNVWAELLISMNFVAPAAAKAKKKRNGKRTTLLANATLAD